ncbi:MAG TPA: hypothetical protein PKC80_04385 [Burkholderiaceae bacterium]|nr:hypothetical protein [Burkholderiaceae bacterium]
MIQLRKIFIACLCLGIAALATNPVYAANKKKSHASAKAKRNKVTYQGYLTDKQIDPGETVRERERRLSRECKGRPNAGACAGFTR